METSHLADLFVTVRIYTFLQFLFDGCFLKLHIKFRVRQSKANWFKFPKTELPNWERICTYKIECNKHSFTLSHFTYSYTVLFYSFALELHTGTDYCTTIIRCRFCLQQVSLKLWYVGAKHHGVTSQKLSIFMVTVTRTWNLRVTVLHMYRSRCVIDTCCGV